MSDSNFFCALHIYKVHNFSSKKVTDNLTYCIKLIKNVHFDGVFEFNYLLIFYNSKSSIITIL